MDNFIMLRPNWGQTFRRIIRDEKGQPVEELFFLPGEPVLVSDDQLKFLQPDLGRALLFCKVDDKGVPQPNKAADDQSFPDLSAPPAARRRGKASARAADADAKG